ncbi:MAG: stage II sporulation protein M, partial [Planctomycetes bacterium]|nr:stage II sporulation protein M [Planctomycetota bacterium]
MIIDLGQFIRQGQVRWRELETFLDRFDAEPQLRLSLEEVKRFHYLYERTSADLVRIGTFSADAETGHHLEVLVARAYGQIHDNRRDRRGSLSAKWFFTAFPRAVRKHTLALCLSLALCFAGMAFGGIALLVDLDAKAVIMPWPHLLGDPSDRVAKEESSTRRLASEKTAFSTMLMTHNTKVSIFALAGGMSFGVVTAVLDFYNGVILGAVCVDYIRAGESVFLAGWLLPHGSIEIPAILIAVQAGFVLGFAMIGTPRGR